jgi:hypothetical protein|nr:DNA cytosine methyltransferase [Akkermansia muciniphila]
MNLLYVDLFCGAGGVTTGISQVPGVHVVACVNHDADAIASHAANHPRTLHYTEDIRTLDTAPMVSRLETMRARYPWAKTVLWASCECTNFSRAKGGKPRDPDSRSLAEHLYRYIEALEPDYIQIENVTEFLEWGPLIEQDGQLMPDPDRKGDSMKDWTGNNRTLGATLGASSHTTEDRQREDYYATHPDMVRDLLNAGAPLRRRVWEPACGAGHIVNVLRERGHEVCATDIVDRGCPDSCVQDFLWEFDDGEIGDVDIMTNPPYATALEFVERALACVKDGDFSKTEGGAIAYAWFHWIKNHRRDCIIKWL